MGRQGTPGFPGVMLLIAGCLWAGIGVTVLEGEWDHWPWLLGGIIVGLWAVQAANRPRGG